MEISGPAVGIQMADSHLTTNCNADTIVNNAGWDVYAQAGTSSAAVTNPISQDADCSISTETTYADLTYELDMQSMKSSFSDPKRATKRMKRGHIETATEDRKAKMTEGPAILYASNDVPMLPIKLIPSRLVNREIDLLNDVVVGLALEQRAS